MAQSAASRRAFIAKKYARRAAGDTTFGTAKSANDNRAPAANDPAMGMTMTVAVNDACVEAAGFADHAGY